MSARASEIVAHQMSYHAAPEGALEDAALMREWARKAVDAAMHAARERRPGNDR